GLLVELCVYHVQLASVTEVVRRCPEVRFVLDHIGKPNIREHVREPWWQDIKAIAALPNVVCKISEIANQADFQSWTIEDLRPYVERALEVFGEDRVMYGAGYPVVLRASSYQRWLDTAETLTSQLSTDGKRKFWGDNARRVYDLPSSVRSAQPEG
ncbi:MAG: amidohydrolase family protein, partial [Chloroflexi bacterium]|nr:amidohydrolase family protein [Chloroflexota bacterium]